MIRLFLCLIISIISMKTANAQSLCNLDTTFRVLHFTKTTGYDHNTRVKSAAMFSEIGTLNGFLVTNTNDATIFNEIDTLNKFAVIIFSNTSGNSVFNEEQKTNFEAYINGGGSYIGIHAASDTYRTGWTFYNTLVGAIVQSNPNHTSQNHTNFMDHQVEHPTLENIPDPWQKQEEYYYWDLNGGMIDTASITTLLKVRETGGNSYDRKRAITWFQEFPSGSRSFYTALGHKNSNYDDATNDFRKLLSNAVCWAAYDPSSSTVINPIIEATDSDIFLKGGTSGIIFETENGACYKMTVGENGEMNTVLIDCPE